MKLIKREAIARILVSFEGIKWDDLEPHTIRFNQGNSQDVYLRRADIIIARLRKGDFTDG